MYTYICIYVSQGDFIYIYIYIYICVYISQGDWLGSVLPFEEARVQVKSLNLGSQDAWDKMVRYVVHVMVQYEFHIW